jgi:hypothetical protein
MLGQLVVPEVTIRPTYTNRPLVAVSDRREIGGLTLFANRNPSSGALSYRLAALELRLARESLRSNCVIELHTL